MSLPKTFSNWVIKHFGLILLLKPEAFGRNRMRVPVDRLVRISQPPMVVVQNSPIQMRENTVVPLSAVPSILAMIPRPMTVHPKLDVFVRNRHWTDLTMSASVQAD